MIVNDVNINKIKKHNIIITILTAWLSPLFINKMDTRPE